MIALDSKLRRASHVRFRMIDDEAVLFAQHSGEILVLDEVGARIFVAIGDESTPAAIVAALAEEYEVAEEKLREDVLVFLEELAEAELLDVGEAG